MIEFAYRNLLIRNEASISSKNEQLKIAMDFDEIHSFPIEDINSIMIENDRTQLSSHSLQSLARNGTAVYFCDTQHMPCGVLLPLNVHSRQLKVLQSQLAMKKPLQKRLWQQIVQQKILNQAECLRYCQRDGSQDLYILAKKVQSGDNTYMESQAAVKYFRLLFGQDFRRIQKHNTKSADAINAGLNYGYAVLRGAVARSLVVYGFEPSLGIFHHSETNRFNLADDLLEPIRPLVDLYVAKNIDGPKLTPIHKQGLYSLLNYEVMLGQERHSASYAIERMVKSFSTVCSNQKGQILLPRLMPLSVHSYE